MIGFSAVIRDPTRRIKTISSDSWEEKRKEHLPFEGSGQLPHLLTGTKRARKGAETALREGIKES